MSIKNTNQHPISKTFAELQEDFKNRKAGLHATIAELKAKVEAAKPEIARQLAALTPEQRADLKEKLARAGITREKIREQMAKVAARIPSNDHQ